MNKNELVLKEIHKILLDLKVNHNFDDDMERFGNVLSNSIYLNSQFGRNSFLKYHDDQWYLDIDMPYHIARDHSHSLFVQFNGIEDPNFDVDTIIWTLYYINLIYNDVKRHPNDYRNS